jgi:hypothetical protein
MAYILKIKPQAEKYGVANLHVKLHVQRMKQNNAVDAKQSHTCITKLAGSTCTPMHVDCSSVGLTNCTTALAAVSLQEYAR